MSASLPEPHYYAIRFVVRHERYFPPSASLITLGAMLEFCWKTDSTTWLIAAVLIAAVLMAAVAWFGARLLVELVAIVADTLLPR